MKKLLQISALAILLLSPKSNFGQYLTGADFKSAKNLALYTINGAVTNTADPSSTTVTGDMGSAVGMVSGYTGKVSGTIFTSNSNATTISNFNSDIQSVATYLNNLTPTFSETAQHTYGTAGQAETVVAGIYNRIGAVSVTNLILDGQNNANSVFVFNINGALTATPNAVVTLINKASILNVYWNTKGGAIVLHPFAQFVGTLIASDALTFQNSATLTGSGYSTGGAIVTTNNQFVGAQQAAAAAVLPITLTSFSATGTNCTANLAWATATESNSSYYAVEASLDGTNFSQTAKIASKNSAIGANYTYVAALANSATTYFRLKAVDNDGKFTYSATVSVKGNGNCITGTTVKVSPNPTSNVLNIQGTETGDLIALFDMNGKKMTGTTATGTNQSISISRYAKGNYILRITKADGSISHVKVVKN